MYVYFIIIIKSRYHPLQYLFKINLFKKYLSYTSHINIHTGLLESDSHVKTYYSYVLSFVSALFVLHCSNMGVANVPQ